MILYFSARKVKIRLALFHFEMDYGRKVLAEYLFERGDWTRGKKLTWEDHGDAKRIAFYITRNRARKGWAMTSPIVRVF